MIAIKSHNSISWIDFERERTKTAGATYIARSYSEKDVFDIELLRENNI